MSTIFFVLLVLYILLFLYSLKIRDNSIVDVFWGVGFMMIALISYFQSDMYMVQTVMTGLICLWGIRIFSHIWLRKLKEKKEDPRYAKWREEWGSGWYFLIRSFLQVYMLQMVLLFIVAIPILLVNIFSEQNPPSPLSQGEIEQIFLVIWAIIALAWLMFEAISDVQLWAFIKTKKPGQIFMSGLYRYSRHPNYFGESVFWLGISLIALPFSYLWLIGWIVITILLLFVSGIPLQEARDAGRPEWEAYTSRTSVFVPWSPKK